MNPEVTQFIEGLDQPWQVEICNRIREIVHQQVPDVAERIQYKKPHFLKGKQYVGVLGPAKGWVSYTIFNAQDVNAPGDLFESSDTGDRKTIKIKPGQDVDYDMLAGLIKQAEPA
jgi:hypothetical protein